MTPLQTALFQVGLSFLVALTTALLTVWLSLRRYYREKWWEAKMRAYTDLIQALHHMKRDVEISIRAELTGGDTDTDFHKEWSAKHRAAWDEIRRQVDVGEFLYSPASMQILQALLNDTKDRDEGYFAHLEDIQTAVEKCLPAVKAAARADLGLPAVKQVISN